MSAIWQNDGTGWRLLSAAGFPAEADLHGLVEQAPHILPLAGSPRLAVVGREVLLGKNFADLIAVEPSGRIVIIEIKLAKNAEARRAVVAQTLTYAAYLRGLDARDFEGNVLRGHLVARGHESLLSAVEADDQSGAIDPETFRTEVAASLAEGRFRLVLVLDTAPDELVQLVGYLSAVADKLLIDLVTVASYDIAGSQVVVPTRVDPERLPPPPESPIGPKAEQGRAVPGADDFEASIGLTAEEHRPTLHTLTAWARALEREGLVTLTTYHGTPLNGVTSRWTLLPRLPSDGVGLVTIWNDRGASLQFWRSVFDRRAPASLRVIERSFPKLKIGKGTSTKAIGEDLLTALTEAYREAARGTIAIEEPARADIGIHDPS